MEQQNILTFDLEWADNLEGVTYTILELLIKEKVKNVIFFVLGDVAIKHPRLIKDIYDEGFEIGTHSHNHKKAYEQTKEEFQKDLIESIFTLRQIIGKDITSYRAPFFSIKEENIDYLEILKDNGIKNDYSIFPASRSNGGIKKSEILKPQILNGLNEYPMSVSNILGKRIAISGGGYFRFFPYWLIKIIMSSKDYNMIYLHIHDFYRENKLELKDKSFKEILITKKGNIGVNGTMKKFQKLLKDFQF